MIYNLVKENDPILKEPIQNFDFENPPVDPVQLANDLFEACRRHRGVALAANQVGLPYRVFVIDTREEKPLALFNCKITDYSEEEEYYEEGCVTYPGLFIKIKRPINIRARVTNELNITETHRFSGMTARIIQHEHDHLEGINFLSRSNKIHRERAKRQLKTLLRRKKIV